MISKPFRVVAVLLAVLAIPAGVTLAGQVILPGTSPFTAGTPIRAAEVNAAFTAVKTAVDDNAARITALEAALAARQGYHSIQVGTDANASVDETWIDVPGTALPVTLGAPSNVRYQLFARVYNYGAAAGTTTSCSVRIVQDTAGTPLNAIFPATMGDWNSVLVGGDGQPGNDKQVALGGLVSLPAGDYVFKAQVVRHTKASANSGNCSIFRWSFSRAQLFVDLVP